MNDVVVAMAQVSSFSAAQSRAFLPWLSRDEAERNARYRFSKDRHRDLIARGLVRGELARHLGIPPAELVFEKNAHGKPVLSMHHGREDCYFNLSHAEDWVVMAIACFPVGIDIEFTPRKNDVLAIADRYFFGDEYGQLMAFPEAERRERFFDYWTLKEAYMKARGEGISLGLSNFGFCLDDGISLQLTSSIEDDASLWQFECTTPFKHYRLATALRAKDAAVINPVRIGPETGATRGF